MQIFLIFALIIAILLVIFALQNTMTIPVTLWAWKVESSIALFLLISFALGALVAVLISLPAVMKRRKKIHALQKQLKSQEQNRSKDNIEENYPDESGDNPFY